MTLAFVDADVLAQATPRTILYLAAALESSTFQLTFSPHVEQEAERAQKPDARRVSVLRKRWQWEMCADHPAPDDLDLRDTDAKDRAVLAAAIGCQARFVVTGNVRHFGPGDLARHSMAAVHPGLFLAERLSSDAYADILTALAANRRTHPVRSTSSRSLTSSPTCSTATRTCSVQRSPNGSRARCGRCTAGCVAFAATHCSPATPPPLACAPPATGFTHALPAKEVVAEKGLHPHP